MVEEANCLMKLRVVSYGALVEDVDDGAMNWILEDEGDISI